MGHDGVPVSAATADIAGRARARAKNRRVGWGRAVGIAALCAVLMLWLAPLYWLVNTTFKLKAQIQSEYPVWFPHPITFENLDYILTEMDFSVVWRSIRVVGASVLVAMVFGPMMAYALSRFHTKANAQIESWIISTRMMPPAALITAYYFLLHRTGLLNTEFGLTLLYCAVNLPLSVWIMLAYLRSLPVDAEEASLLDGCSRWGAFRHVVVPMMRSSIAAAGLIMVILTWNEFFLAFVIMSSNITFPVHVGSFLANGMSPEYGHMAAAGLLQSLPPILLALVFHRSLLSGLHAFAGGK